MFMSKQNFDFRHFATDLRVRLSEYLISLVETESLHHDRGVYITWNAEFVSIRARIGSTQSCDSCELRHTTTPTARERNCDIF